jgi:hypothetical protein
MDAISSERDDGCRGINWVGCRCGGVKVRRSITRDRSSLRVLSSTATQVRQTHGNVSSWNRHVDFSATVPNIVVVAIIRIAIIPFYMKDRLDRMTVP